MVAPTNVAFRVNEGIFFAAIYVRTRPRALVTVDQRNGHIADIAVSETIETVGKTL